MKQLIIIATLFCLFTSCKKDRLTANGEQTTATRELNSFAAIRSSGAHPIKIKYGNEFKVVLKGSTNLLPYFKTEVSNNKLVLGYENANVNHDDLQVEVTLPVLKSISLNGSSRVDVSGEFPLVNLFNVEVSGSANVMVTNNLNADNLDITISGSGDMDLEKLTAKQATIGISGSGNARVKVRDEIKATISGSGRVYYLGNPTIDSRISGSGSVIKIN
jgi:hypothetical protein